MNRYNKTRFVELLFKNLVDYKIKFCVLRNYQNLPGTLDGDLDLWIGGKYREIFVNLLSQTIRDSGWSLISYEGRLSWAGEGNYFLYYRNTAECLHLDCYIEIAWRGTNFIGDSAFHQLNFFRNNIFIPRPGVESAVTLLKCLLYTGRINSRYHDAISEQVNSDRDNFIQSLSQILGKKLVFDILHKITVNDWIGIEKRAGFIKLRLLLNSLPPGLKQIRQWLAYLNNLIKKYLIRRNGFFLVFVGPDGSGKTTLTNLLFQSELKYIFQNKIYFHGNFKILPELNNLRKLIPGGKKPENIDNLRMARELPVLMSIIYPIYYSFDFILGHLILWKARSQNQFIINDRYFFDYYLQKLYCRCPVWILDVLVKIIPKPDLTIYLKTNEKLIYSRKPELSVDEIREQQEKCSRLCRKYPEIIEIENDADIENTKNKIMNAAAEKLAAR